MLELYHWEPNGSFLKPLIALHEKGLAFAGRYIDMLALAHRTVPPLPPSLETRHNMEGEGPLLVHDGRQITESLFMIEYLEDAFPDALPLRPLAPAGRAEILAWARFINERFMPAVNLLGCHRWLVPLLADRRARLRPLVAGIEMKPTREGWERALDDAYPETMLADAQRGVSSAVARIEARLGDRDWLVGDAYSLADIDAFSIALALPELTPDLVSPQVAPRLNDWMARIRARPAVLEALASGRTAHPERAFLPGPEIARWG